MRLQAKFLALLLPAVLLAVAVVIVTVRRAVEAVVVGGVESSAIVLAKAAAEDASPGLASGRETDLLPTLQALRRWKAASFAAALDRQGRILAHTTIAERGKIDDDPLLSASWRSDEPVAKRSFLGAQAVLVVAAPVLAPPAPFGGEEFLLSGTRPRLGTLKLVVPLASTLEAAGSIAREITAIVVVAAVVLTGLIIFLLRGILAPVRGLMAGVARVGAGQYDVTVPEETQDELGDLARSFNAMSGELTRTTVSKNYFEGVLENMYDLLMVADLEGRIQTVNRAAADVLGEGGQIGRPLAGVFDSPPPVAGAVRGAEAVLRTKGGGRMTALISSSALSDREGKVVGSVVVAKDITARKRAEESLLSAKLAAEAANRELETFSYSVAHDLRAPLRAVDGFSHLLLDEYAARLDDKGKDLLRRVRAGSAKMGALIDDLLALSRIARSSLRLETVDLSALAAGIAADLSKAEPSRRVEFVIAPGLTARGDAGLLRVALVNLLGNSWKYTRKHERARVEFGVERVKGGTVYFVRDDGAGFDMAYARKLFQPFTRLHTAAEFEGTGIGLATVARVIARHEGRVWAEGEVERGAVFRFTLWEGTL